MRNRRLASVYRGMALVFLNTLVVFLCANGVAALYLLFRPHPIPSSFAPRQKATLPVAQLGALKYGLDRLRRIYPKLSDEQVIRLVLESWNVQLLCDPDTLYTEEPFEGDYITVDEGKFRRIERQGPWPPEAHAFKIFVFGGSTTFGYGEADGQTIPSYLQEKVRQATGREDIFVYNFGHSFFFSRQERMAFEALLRKGTVPDLAIFIDGLNEFYHWNGEPTMRPCVDRGTVWERFRKTLMCREDEICWPIQRLAMDLRIVRRLSVAAGAASSRVDAPPPVDDAVTNRAVVERWIKNKYAIEELAAQRRTKTLFVRQPVPTYAYDQTYHVFPDDLGQHARSGWGYKIWEEMLGDEHARGWTDNLLDLAHLGEGKALPLYVDAVHYTSGFMDEIATAITRALIAKRLIVEPPKAHQNL